MTDLDKQQGAIMIEALMLGAFLSWVLGSAAVKFIGYSSIWFPICGFGGMLLTLIWWTVRMKKLHGME